MYNVQLGSGSKAKIFSIRERTYNFGVEIVKLVLGFPRNAAGYTIGDQLIRSGTSIGANVEEGQNSGSKKEFIHSLTISLKEAREIEYWLRMVFDTGLVEKAKLELLLKEINEIIKILTTIIKKTKQNLAAKKL